MLTMVVRRARLRVHGPEGEAQPGTGEKQWDLLEQWLGEYEPWIGLGRMPLPGAGEDRHGGCVGWEASSPLGAERPGGLGGDSHGMEVVHDR